MNEPRQAYMKLMGEEGCYILSLVHLGERITHERIDAIAIFLEGMQQDLVQSNCLVVDAAGLLSMMTGVQWKKTYQTPDYRPKEGELEILRFERKTGAGTLRHYVVGDGRGLVVYDPLGDSKTVRSGKLESKRIFSRV